MPTKEQIDSALERPQNFGYFGDLPLFDTWSLGPVIEHRDSTLLDRANSISFKEALEEHSELNGQWQIETMNHWAVGWVEHLCFKVINDDGSPTEIFQFILDWKEKLEDYPVADEELYSELEMNATFENIEFVGNGLIKDNHPEDWVNQVYRWFWDNNQTAIENSDDQGGWPTNEEMKDALRSLNLLHEYYSEEEE